MSIQSANQQKRILIVEDEKNLALTLSIALKRASNGNFAITVCHHGHDALPLIESQKFDLIISDLRLPDTSGLSLLEKAKFRHPDTRTIMMTAFGSEQVKAQAKLVTNAYLTKPFNLPDMVQLVKQAVL